MCSRLSPTCIVFLLSAVFGVHVFADSLQRAVVPIEVNGVARGDILVVIGEADFYVTPEDLGNLGVQGLNESARTTILEGTYVSLASLAPVVKYRFDESRYSLSLEVDPNYLPRTTRSLSMGRPAEIVSTGDTSAFFNYALGSQRLRDTFFFGETGLSVRGNLLYSSFSRSVEGDFTRGLTNFTIDQPDRLRRTVVGDSFVVSDPLGGAALIGGVSLTRNFGLDPYFVRFPSLDLAGAVTSPSVVDIYVNGSLVRSEQLPPGTFDLQDLPLTAGSGSTRVVIRDAFGRERVVDRAFYGSTALLSRGLSEYSYNLGFVRHDESSTSADYEQTPVFAGFHRRGLTDSLTGGIRLEAGKELASAGVSLGFLLPLGQFEFSTGISAADGEEGGAAALSFSYLSRSRFSMGASLRAMTDQYANISLAPQADRSVLDGSVFTATTFGISTISLQYSTTANRDTPDSDRIGATLTFPVGRRANLFLSAGRSDTSDAQPVNDVFAGLSYFLGRGTTANLSASRNGDSSSGSIDVQRSLPPGNGFGYRLSAPLADSQTVSNAVLQYQGPYGRYELNMDPENVSDDYTVSAAGGIVAIGGSVYFSRPFSQSFALMRVPRVAGVQVSASNLKVGRTNRRGEFLIPNLLPYYGNRLGIDEHDVPFDYQIQEVERIIAPPYRGGALVSFPVRKVQSVTGTIRIVRNGALFVPSFGDLEVTADDRKFESPIGAEGEFYLENAPAGTFPATVTFEGAPCKFEMTISTSEAPFVRLDELRCFQDAP